jgi:hypothetical protein
LAALVTVNLLSPLLFLGLPKKWSIARPANENRQAMERLANP